MRTKHLLLLGLLLAGCRDGKASFLDASLDDAEKSESGTNTNANTEPPKKEFDGTIESFCEMYSLNFCALENLQDLTQVKASDFCVRGMRCAELTKRWKEQIASGGLTFDVDKARECLATLSTWPRRRSDAELYVKCRFALVGKKQADAPCQFDEECEGYCDTKTSCPGVCRAFAGIDQSCEKNRCGLNLFCFSEPRQKINNVCKPIGGALGEPCTTYSATYRNFFPSDSCKSKDLYCSSDLLPVSDGLPLGHCLARKAIGEACVNPDECSSAICTYPLNKCLTAVAENDPCEDDEQCSKGFICVPKPGSASGSQAFCLRPERKLNGFCNTQGDCGPSDYCLYAQQGDRYGKCQEGLGVGSTCEFSNIGFLKPQCRNDLWCAQFIVPNHVEFHICQKFLGEGETCSTSSNGTDLCGYPLFCHQNKCRGQSGELGDPCRFDNNCLTGSTCGYSTASNSSICQVRKPHGEACRANSECLSGNCGGANSTCLGRCAGAKLRAIVN